MVVQHVSDLPFPTDSILAVIRGVYSHRAPLHHVNRNGPACGTVRQPREVVSRIAGERGTGGIGAKPAAGSSGWNSEYDF